MEIKINSILIPTDFSELSESALKVGIAIAKRQNAEITLLHVIDRMAYLQPTEVFVPDIRLSPDYIAEIKERLNILAGRILIDTGVKVVGNVIDGQAAEEICSFAYRKRFNLIVMGTHGTSGLKEFFIGSEAFRVVKNAPCPVLTIPGDWQKTDFERVLFPIRLKAGAIEKYYYAQPIIEKNNSELFLLGLGDKNSPSQIKELVLLVDRLKIQLHNDNVKFQTAYCPSEDFSSTVIQTAHKSQSDLIVLTANLDYDFKAYFFGPYSQQIVNHSKLPVLSIKPLNDQVQPESTLSLAKNWGKSINLSELNAEG
ncbi:MAG: universal stress protein [Tenuifilaceae bacterium]